MHRPIKPPPWMAAADAKGQSLKGALLQLLTAWKTMVGWRREWSQTCVPISLRTLSSTLLPGAPGQAKPKSITPRLAASFGPRSQDAYFSSEYEHNTF